MLNERKLVQKKNRQKKNIRTRRKAAVVAILVYAELCFCGGYILAHKKDLDARRPQKTEMASQHQSAGGMLVYNN